LASLLGPGSGLCLDLGCGSGLYLDVIRSTGRSPVGLELSADQLRLARRRGDRLVQADGAALPFADDAFETVTAVWISTDVDDFARVMRESARVLRPGGLFVFFGVHPCFNGPCVEDREDGSRIVHPTYRCTGRHDSAPWWGPGGIRDRVGMRHLPLAELINAVIDAGLRISRIVEPRDDPIPAVLALAARKDTVGL
jgi:SAM-dependent methyltransferase